MSINRGDYCVGDQVRERERDSVYMRQCVCDCVCERVCVSVSDCVGVPVIVCVFFSPFLSFTPLTISPPSHFFHFPYSRLNTQSSHLFIYLFLTFPLLPLLFLPLLISPLLPLFSPSLLSPTPHPSFPLFSFLPFSLL